MKNFFLCFRSPREAGLVLMGLGTAWLACAILLDGPGTVVTTSVITLMAALGLLWYDRSDYSVKVDIWESQEMLMLASDQRMPSTPCVTDGSILYVALTLEELSETLDAFDSTFSRRSNAPGRHLDSITGLASRLDTLRKLLHAESVIIRTEVSRIGAFSLPMTRAEAVQALDGVTDSAVTIAGLGLASGLPVRAGYVEVAGSNLSKRNPDTLVIAKDPSGKWIKGRNYQPPNLEAVMESHWRSTNFGGI